MIGDPLATTETYVNLVSTQLRVEVEMLRILRFSKARKVSRTSFLDASRR